MADIADIVAFVSEERVEPVARITSETRLLHDLGVDGDDADELIQAFAKRFNVDLTGFSFREYFYGEPHLFSYSGSLQHFIGVQYSKKRPLTISALVETAERGHWTDVSSQAH